MAGSAELLRQPKDAFWDHTEVQFAGTIPETSRGERPPESEIYGRSLSTIHQLGAFAVGKSQAEVVHSPEAAQAKAEFYTSVEEGFGTDMELGGVLEVRDFDCRPVISGKVMSKDLKTPVSDMTEAGLICAIETAEEDEHFLPQLVRSKWDHANAEITDSMARGETDYNTRIVISPFPEEAAAESGDDYWRGVGYVPHLRRGFVQLYHATEDGLVAGSLSFDGSDKERLRELFGKHGVDIPEEEVTDNWLQYAVTATLPEDEAKELAMELAEQAGDPNLKKTTNTVEVTSGHRTIMDTVFNDSYIHACESFSQGRQTAATRELVFQLADKAQYFNSRYQDALYKMRSNGDNFNDDDMIVLHELLVYSTIEMMRALHLQATRPDSKSDFYNAAYLDAAYLQSLDQASFQNMLSGFGAEGARNSRTYSACGLAISPGGVNPGEGPQHAFGGNAAGELSTKKWMNCPFCPAKVYDDPCAKILCCPDCKAKVVNGRVVSKGNGGSRTRNEQTTEERQEAEPEEKDEEGSGVMEQELTGNKKIPATSTVAYN